MTPGPEKVVFAASETLNLLSFKQSYYCQRLHPELQMVVLLLHRHSDLQPTLVLKAQAQLRKGKLR